MLKKRLEILFLILAFAASTVLNIQKGEPCEYPYCSRGTCLVNEKSLLGFLCICQRGYFGELCKRDYLSCPTGGDDNRAIEETACASRGNEASYIYRDVCYKLVFNKMPYEDFVNYCLANKMMPAEMKSLLVLTELKQKFRNYTGVYIGLTYENYESRWYDGTEQNKFEPSEINNKVQCGMVDFENETVLFSNCSQPREFLCQRNMDCIDSLNEFATKNPCVPNPCLNDGVCYQKPSQTYECFCKETFGGQNCSYEIIAHEVNNFCNMTGAVRFHNDCYKLFDVKSSDKYWMETTCLEQNAYIVDDFKANSTEEIIFLANLIDDVQADQFDCIVTAVTRSKPNIENILIKLAKDPRIVYHSTLENPNEVLFICVLKTVNTLNAILQFRNFDDNILSDMYFVCKQSAKNDVKNNTCSFPNYGQNSHMNLNPHMLTVVNYTCFEGMVPVENTNSTRTCSEKTNDWTGRALECEYPSCPSVPPKLNQTSRIIQRTNYTIVYECLDDYYSPAQTRDFEGTTYNLTCLSAENNKKTMTRWSNATYCTEKKKCPYPYEILNAEMTLSADKSTVTYKCLYTQEVFSRTCNGGVWSGSLPRCGNSTARTSCALPPIVANSRFATTGYGVNSTVYYSCIDGFKEYFRNRNTSVCLKDFIWTANDFRCLQTTCQKTLKFDNGSVAYSGTNQNDLAVLSCPLGFKLKPPVYYYKCSNGVWKVNETEMGQPECVALRCPKPQLPSYLTYEASPSSMSNGEFNLLSTISLICPNDSQIIGDQYLVCLSDGTWSTSLPTCKKIECNAPPAMENAIPSYVDKHVGSKVNYVCMNGYEMRGADPIGGAYLTCMRDKKWNGSSNFRCMEMAIKCRLPEPIEHGVMVYNGISIGSTVKYRCDFNYLLSGSTTRVCQSNGVWSGELPNCKLIACPLPKAPQDGSVSLDDKAHRFGSTSTFECNKGFMLAGASERICLLNSHWSDGEQEPHCDRIACPPLEPIKNGVVTYLDTNVNATATYSCDTGFTLTDGTGTRTCQSNLKWTGKSPSCRRIRFKFESAILEKKHLRMLFQPLVENISRKKREATVPSSIVGKNETRTQFNFMQAQNELVIFDYAESKMDLVLTCNNFSRPLTASNQLVVKTKSDIDKIDSSLKCKAIQCKKLNESTFPEKVYIVKATGQNYGDYVVFGCKDGFVLNHGSSLRICMEDGTWSGETPTCSMVYCGLPKSGVNSYWEFGATSAIALYFCHKGFKGESGDQYRSCYVDPSDQVIKWLGSPLNCSDVVCDGFNLTNTTVEVSSYKFGSIAFFQCKIGYRAVAGNFLRICSEYGTWSGEELRCESIDEFRHAYQEKNALKIVSSRAFGGVAIGFIVSMFLTACIADTKWHIICSRVCKTVRTPNNKIRGRISKVSEHSMSSRNGSLEPRPSRKSTDFRLQESRLSHRHRRFSRFNPSRRYSKPNKAKSLFGFNAPKREKLTNFINSFKKRSKAAEDHSKDAEALEKIREDVAKEMEFSQVAVSSAQSQAQTQEQAQKGSQNSLVSRSQLLNQIDKITKVEES